MGRRTLLREFLEGQARLEADPLCPEIRAFNTRRLPELWEMAERRSRRGNAEVPFWGVVWPGGRALARFLLDHKELVAGKRVLDLGAGAGIAAVAAAVAGGRATALDRDRHALAMARITARANRVHVRAVPGSIGDLAQGARAGRLAELARQAEVIVAGDVFYTQPLAEECLAFLRACAARGALCLAGDGGRQYAPTAGRLRTMIKTPVFREIEGVASREVRIYEIEAR